MNKYLFDNWNQWKVCFLAGCSKFGWGFCRIVTSILLGILSIIRYLWRCVVHFVKVNPVFSICVFVIILILTWLLTFMQMRSCNVSLEHQRDSLSYELSKFTQMYGSINTTDTMVCDNGFK